MKLLSVSVAAYNVENYLRETLDSFIDYCDDERIEVLIVNDGSTDNTLKISTEYSNKWPNLFKIIDKKNGGWGSTINSSINIASGKYFKQLDGDDFFDKSNLRQFLNLLENLDVDLIYTPYNEFDSSTHKILSLHLFNGVEFQFDKILDFSKCVSDLPFTMHACTFKTEILKKNNIKLQEKCFYTDKEFILKASLYINNIYFWNKTIYCYRVARAGQSMSPEGLAKHYEDLIKITNVFIDIYNHKKLANELQKLFLFQIKNTIEMTYSAFYWMQPTKDNKVKLTNYDNWLKVNCKEFYSINNFVLKIDRIFKFKLYYLFCFLRKIKKSILI